MKTGNKLLAGFALIAFLFAGASAAVAAPQTICPVMGNKVNPNIFLDYKGKRIYFCCPPCPSRFKQNPEAYLQRLAQIGQEPVAIPGS